MIRLPQVITVRLDEPTVARIRERVGRDSLPADRRRKAKRVSKKGEGDRGDQKRRKVKQKKR